MLLSLSLFGGLAVSCATGSHPPETPEIQVELPPLPELETSPDDGLLVEVPLRQLKKAILVDEAYKALVERRSAEVTIMIDTSADWERYAEYLEKRLRLWQVFGGASAAALLGVILAGLL